MRTHVERANRDTVELVAVGADVADIEVIREVLSRCGKALGACLRALDEDDGAFLGRDGFDALLEEGSNH